MAAVTIRNLSDEAHRALKVRAAQNNRSAEAEMRAILEAAVRPEDRLRLGTALSDMSRKIGLTNADVEALDHARDTGPAAPRDTSAFDAAGLTVIDPWSAGR
ncbi:FitA-like ribbon-helix-helix domain-containing protein [Methylobacterium oryzisoli]|uniref:FitA-like ribbon-helix-helix domain-containing protein n=1 Tax=Methylobacterium oryzisoli TaxID=3385502 RepID=UPI00389265CD